MMKMMLIGLFFGMVANANTHDTDEAVFPFRYDVETAYELIGGEHTLGRCQLHAEWDAPDGKFLRIELRVDEGDGKHQDWKMRFSNHENHLSFVRIDYQYLGFGDPHTVTLERVDIQKVPATKWRFIFGVKSGRPSTLRIERIFGWSWNAPRVISCQL